MEIAIAIIIAGIIISTVIYFTTRKPETNVNAELISHMIEENNKSLNEMRKSMHEELSEARKMQFASSQDLNKRLDKSAEVIGSVQKQLGQVGEATKQMQEIGKNISSLQDILRNPKARGNFGELLLENLLSQMFPHEHYEMQYKFKNDKLADAVLKLKDKKIVAIDSKFPLEDFQRLLACKSEEERVKMKKALIVQTKKHVDEIAKKYILPDEGTLDFAFMYVPAENVYYELTTSEENILDYAWKNKVFIVSPNSFYAYLVTVLRGLQALEIEKNIVKIQNDMKRVGVEFEKFGEDYRKVGVHLQRANSSYNESDSRLGHLKDRMQKALTGQTEENLLD